MSTELCRLCRLKPPIEHSHVISRFVFRAIKSDSPTGFFRNPNNPNLRIQDGDKLRLLCSECEQRFGNVENEFAKDVFADFHERDRDRFSYGPWLHYFMTSLAWRTLTLDLPGLESDNANPRGAMKDLTDAAETMRLYLLGANNLAVCLRNHAVAWTKCDTSSNDLAAIGPNVMIRRSVFGYTVLERTHGFSGVLHNLAGFMCFLIVKGKPQDNWSGTKVNPLGGEIRQPQHVKSWLMTELMNCLIESAQSQTAISDIQRQKVAEAMRKNPSASGLRFRELDKRILTTQ